MNGDNRGASGDVDNNSTATNSKNVERRRIFINCAQRQRSCLAAKQRLRTEFTPRVGGNFSTIRRVVALAAFSTGMKPWQVSFKGTMQTLAKLLPLLETSILTSAWCAALLKACAAHEVGQRPGRVEPRVNKRRPKILKLMTKPRHQYQAELNAAA